MCVFFFSFFFFLSSSPPDRVFYTQAGPLRLDVARALFVRDSYTRTPPGLGETVVESNTAAVVV